MKLDHARHNRDACDSFIQLGNYNDWVITTAFYSAIHFIDHKLFPLIDYRGRSVSDIGQFSKMEGVSKHEARILIISLRLPSQNTNFGFLYNQCLTARYINYHVSLETAEKAREKLRLIEEECTNADD